ncbi:UNVERIFIED_CONTAM: hypothetical protein RMT77_005039 [Armadillidium vulgare]
MVFSIFRLAYYRLHFTYQSQPHKNAKEYSVTFPDTSFRAEHALPTINQMLMQIKNICPKAKLYLMIPPFPDLDYYNVQRNIDFAPTEVKDWYYSLPRSSPRHVNEDTRFIYQELMKLHSPNIKWSGKRTLALSESLYLMRSSTRHNYERLIDSDNDIYSLRQTGPLVDGIHPTKEFMEAFWKLLRNYEVFETTKDLPKHPSQIPSLMTNMTKPDVTKRPKLIPRERVSGDYRREECDKHFRFSHLVSDSPPSSNFSPSEENLPSTSSGISDSNRSLNAHPAWASKKRSCSSSLQTSSKRLQTSFSLPSPIQHMTLAQIDLIQGKFNMFISYMLGITHLNTPNITEADLEDMVNFFFRNFSSE